MFNWEGLSSSWGQEHNILYHHTVLVCMLTHTDNNCSLAELAGEKTGNWNPTKPSRSIRIHWWKKSKSNRHSQTESRHCLYRMMKPTKTKLNWQAAHHQIHQIHQNRAQFVTICHISEFCSLIDWFFLTVASSFSNTDWRSINAYARRPGYYIMHRLHTADLLVGPCTPCVQTCITVKSDGSIFIKIYYYWHENQTSPKRCRFRSSQLAIASPKRHLLFLQESWEVDVL